MGYILDTSAIPHTILRGRIYYFQMRVPKRHQQIYGPLVRARLSECGKEAAILAGHLSHLLKQAWQSNTKVKVCIEQALQSVRPAKTTLAAVAEEYITARRVDAKSSMVAVRALLLWLVIVKFTLTRGTMQELCWPTSNQTGTKLPL